MKDKFCSHCGAKLKKATSKDERQFPKRIDTLEDEKIVDVYDRDVDQVEEYYIFLDGLRESGVTNMYGATSYLVEAFPELDNKTAKRVLSDWMNTFSERHKPEEPERERQLRELEEE